MKVFLNLLLSTVTVTGTDLVSTIINCNDLSKQLV